MLIKNFNNFSFFLLNFFNFKVYHILLIFRFSKFFHSYALVYSNFFFNLDDFNYFQNIQILSNFNNFQNYYNLFFLENFNKYETIKLVSGIRKNNLLKKYNNFKRSLFYDKHIEIKKLHFRHLNAESDDEFNLEKEKIIKPNFSCNPEFFNFSFFKNLSKKNCHYNFNKKNKLLYKMHKNFFSRYYANRLIFKNIFLKSKFIHQFKITKFVEKFKKNTNLNFYRQTQIFLFIVLLSSQFFFFKKDCFFFLKNYGIFLNGRLCTNAYRCLKPGDVLQIPINNFFFIFYKNYKNYTSFFLRKYKLKFNKIFAAHKAKYRTKSYLTPKWVEYLPYYYEDVPKNLEVDYTILTIILLYYGDTFYDTHPAISNNILFYLYRIYNWRRLN